MSSDFMDLRNLRGKALRLILGILWVQVPLTALAGWMAGTNIVVLVAVSVFIAGATHAVAAWDRDGNQARIAAAVGLMASISILVAAFDGHGMQVDLHMYYFASLAVLAAFCDWRVIAAGATTVAVHHTGLNFLLPALIYPGGADVSRLAMHAGILVLEAAALTWLTVTLERMFDAIKIEAARAQGAQLEAEKNHRDLLATVALADHASRLHEQELALRLEEDQTTQSLATALHHLADGDLTYRITTPLPSRAEPLRAHFNGAMEKLQDTLQVVSTTTSAIRGGTGEISSASDDLSRRTEQQAASLEETAAALDEITATVRKTASGSKHARDVVGEAKQAAEHSGQVMRQAVDAMGGIEKSAGQIGNIIGVIDEIAFQTNLLALNAGVEAARAGEAGRGFAVVASEVRALAQRSAEAAKEIKTLISASSTQVEQGVSLVGQTGKALELIVTQVAQINSIVSDIAASAQEQAVGLDQVNTAMNQMDQVTQQNAAMVEETTAASHALMRESEELTRLLGRFSLGPDGQAAASSAPRRLARAPKPSEKTAPVAAMKSMGRGGAARRPEVDPDGWQEF